MAYYLGIDLGTTYTAAAVWREGRVEIANLGTRAPVVPSVVFLRDDGTILTGESAERRALTEPQRVAREFKRRVGDSTPIIVGGTPYSADALTARLLRWVVDSVAEREGEAPAGVVVSHPANWGPFKQDLLRQSIRVAGLDDAATITEPEAAAIHYASQERVEPGSVVAVYDLGGGTFDAAVLRRTAGGWEILGEPEGIERLGGIDFDQAVFFHVQQAIGEAVEALDPDDPAAVAALSRLRRDCVEAKEALASDVDVVIPVMLPTIQTDVRLTRSEFEAMIRPTLVDSIAALRRALRSAGVEPVDVGTVLLVGGSSRIPLVAQLIGSELGRPVAVDAHPKHGVALGAAIIAAEQGTGRVVDTQVVPTVDVPTPGPDPTAPDAPTDIAAAALAAGAVGPAPTPEPPQPIAAGPTEPTQPVDATPAGHRTGPTQPLAPSPGGRPTEPTQPVGPSPGGRPTEPTQPVGPSPAGQGTGLTQPFGAEPAQPGAGGPGQVSAPAEPLVGNQAGGFGGPAGGQVTVPRGAVGSSSQGGASGERTPPPAAPRRGDRSDSDGGGSGSKRTALLVAVAVVAVLGIVGAGLAAGGGDGDDGGEDSAAGATDPTTAEVTTTDPGAEGNTGLVDPEIPEVTTTTTAPPPAGPAIRIDYVTLEAEQYRVTYTITGYTPDEADPEALHTHFFLDTTAPGNAGTNGAPPGDWYLTYESGSVLTDYGPASQGTATQMCAVVADHGHGVVDPDSGNCVELPT